MSGPAHESSFTIMQETGAALRAIRAPIESELKDVQKVIETFFGGDSRLLSDLAAHVRHMPGKKLRPILLLLSAGVGGVVNDRAVRAAAMVELVHTATLIHDDSIDESLTRRGLPTINALWSDRVSTILGDYLYTRAFNTLVQDHDWAAVRVLARTAHRMTLGEMLQMEQKNDLDVTEPDYLRLITEKTASLFSAACEMGAATSFDDDAEHTRYRDFGYELGMAFQIVDDLFDYCGDPTLLGKDIGCDLREGKITLPVIHGLTGAPPEIRALVAGVVERREVTRDEWAQLTGHLDRAGSYEFCRQKARCFAERARSLLVGSPAGPHLDALTLAVDFVVQRTY